MFHGFGLLRRRTLLGVLAGLAVVGLGAVPAAAAPFVYSTTYPPGNSGIPPKIFQFDAPSANREALQPLSPASISLPNAQSGAGAWQAAVSPEGNSLYAVNFGAPGMVWQLNINPSTGKLSPKSPATVTIPADSANAVVLTPDGKSAYVSNGNNTISQFNVSRGTGKLHPKSPASVAAGKGPGAEAVSPDGKSLYVISGAHGGSVLQYNINGKTGKLSRKSPASVAANGAGAEAVSPNGKSLYVISGAHGGSVLQYDINRKTGKLHPKSPAKVAANGAGAEAVSPDGKSLYVTSGSSTVLQFNINQKTGRLSPKSPASVSAPGASTIAVTPDSESAYVIGDGVLQFNINRTTGTLSSKSPASVFAGHYPQAVVVSPDADVSVKVRAPASIRRGSELTYAIKVKNAGPSHAWQVKLTDRLPSGTKFVKLSAPRARCTSPKAGATGATVTCKLGRLRPGKGAKVRIVVKVIAKGTISNLAKVTSVTPDPLSSNNTTTAHTKVK